MFYSKDITLNDAISHTNIMAYYGIRFSNLVLFQW